MRRIAVLLIATVPVTACLRVVTPGPPDASGAAPVLVTAIDVDAVRPRGPPGELLCYGGDVLLITGSGWNPALATARLGSTELGVDRAASTETVLRAVVPPRPLEGAIVVTSGAQSSAESAVRVRVLGVGHPSSPRFLGTVQTLMAIRAAGTSAPACQPSLVDGGVDCGLLPDNGRRLAVAFSFGPDVVYRDPTYVTEFVEFGDDITTVTTQLGPPQTDLRAVTAVRPWGGPRPGGGYARGVAAHQEWYADGGYASRVDTFPMLFDAGAAYHSQVFVPTATGGLYTFDVASIGPGGIDEVHLSRDGEPVLLLDGGPMRLGAAPAAAGSVVQGWDLEADARHAAEVLALSCGAVRADGMREVTFTRFFPDDGAMKSLTHGVPLSGAAPCAGSVSPAGCQELADCPDCFGQVILADDPQCRAAFPQCQACLADATCRARIAALATCIRDPACLAELACGGADAGACSCSHPSCAAARACLADASCRPPQDCFGGCLVPPSCIANPSGCAHIMACLADDACVDRAMCAAAPLGCATQVECARSVCSREGPAELEPLAEQSFLVRAGRPTSAFGETSQSVCAVEAYGGRLQSVFPYFPALSHAVVTSEEGQQRLFIIPGGGASRTLFVLNLDTGAYYPVTTRTAYTELLKHPTLPMVYGVPSSGAQVDLLDGRGQFAVAVAVLGQASHAFPLPADDGRTLLLHPEFALVVDANGSVVRHAFHGARAVNPELPARPGALPAGLWGVRRLPEGSAEMVHVDLGVDAPEFGTVRVHGRLPAELASGSLHVDSMLGVEGAVLASLQWTVADPDDPCGGERFVAVMEPGASATAPVSFQPVAGTCGTWLAGYNQQSASGLLLVVPRDDNAGGTRRLVRSGTTWRVGASQLPGLVVAAEPHPAGGFIGVFVTTSGASRLELGLVSPTDPPVYEALMDAPTSDATITVSPDGARLYIGGADRVLEVELAPRCRGPAAPTPCEPWQLVARAGRAASVEGRVNALAMDEQGTRLVYVDWERERVGELQ